MTTALQDNYNGSAFGGFFAKKYGPTRIVYEDPTTRVKALGKAKIMKTLGVEGEHRGLPILRVHAWFPKTNEDKEVLILGMPDEAELDHLRKNWEFVDRRTSQLATRRQHRTLPEGDPDNFIVDRAMELDALLKLRDAVDFAIGAREKYA